ncbi:hypothetical protein HA402_008277 [Bradysia odoriphaga]|nr:hypothetical protein HA402_008277 [Bradysia odoriphaga]
MPKPKLVIFDTDMGTDDAWALFMLLKAEKRYNVKILGITVVHGNASLENAAENALRVLSATDRLDIRVYKGAVEPLVKESKKNFYHGINGFGDVVLPTTIDLNLIDSENAVNYMYRMVKENPKQISLIAVGPLTNVALAMKMFPDFAELVKDIWVMGGNYSAIGNCKSECAEFNFFADPEAAYVVLKNTKRKITIVPWEACMQQTIDISMDYRFNEIAKIKSCVTDLMNPVDEAIYKPKNKAKWNPCDAFLVSVFLENVKAVKRSTDCFATVELNGEMTRGQVAIYHMSGSEENFNVTMIEAINTDVCRELLRWTAIWTEDSPDLSD